MAENAGAVAAMMEQLSNQNRLVILCTLIDEEYSTGELNQLIPLSQGALCQHLSSLRNAELVEIRRDPRQSTTS